MDKEEKIIEFMKSKEYVPMKAKEMADLLEVPKSEFFTFKKILNKLEEDFKIQINRKSKYRILDENKYLAGIFKGHEKGFRFCYNRRSR